MKDSVRIICVEPASEVDNGIRLEGGRIQADTTSKDKKHVCKDAEMCDHARWCGK